MFHRAFIAFAVLSVLGIFVGQGSSAIGAEGDHKPAPKGPKTTTGTGVLEDKGVAWIKVKFDGSNESLELKAEWMRGADSKFLKPMKPDEELFKNLKVGGKVEVEWRQGDAAKFAVRVKMLENDAPAAKTESAKKEEGK